MDLPSIPRISATRDRRPALGGHAKSAPPGLALTPTAAQLEALFSTVQVPRLPMASSQGLVKRGLRTPSFKEKTNAVTGRTTRVKDDVSIIYDQDGKALLLYRGAAGFGGFGRTYAAIDVESGAEFAAKKVLLDKSKEVSLHGLTLHIGRSNLKQFAREAGVARLADSALTPERIVVYRHKKGGQKALALMQPMRGSLLDVLPTLQQPANEALRESVALDVMERVLGDLEPLHAGHDGIAAGHMHRDIKAENIMFDARQPHLGDFGLACELGTPAAQDAVGTIAYAAPELFWSMRRADGAIVPYNRKDEKMDLFSTGSTVLKLLAGADHPWERLMPIGLRPEAEMDGRATADEGFEHFFYRRPMDPALHAVFDQGFGRVQNDALRELLFGVMHPDPTLRLSASEALAVLRREPELQPSLAAREARESFYERASVPREMDLGVGFKAIRSWAAARGIMLPAPQPAAASAG